MADEIAPGAAAPSTYYPPEPPAAPVHTNVRLTDGVHLAEWNQWLPPGTVVAVHGELLTDPRFVGKFEIVKE